MCTNVSQRHEEEATTQMIHDIVVEWGREDNQGTIIGHYLEVLGIPS